MTASARIWIIGVLLAAAACRSGADDAAAPSDRQGTPAASSAPRAAAPAPQEKPAAAAPAQAPAPAQDSAEADAVARARTAIKKHQLTRLTSDCIKLEVDGASEGTYAVQVYEVHDAKCGGDPETEPRLFSVNVKPQTGEVWTDADSEDGELRKLP